LAGEWGGAEDVLEGAAAGEEGAGGGLWLRLVHAHWLERWAGGLRRWEEGLAR
jgi:hypothetical protein